MTKTCPANPTADSQWFYYEGTGRLLRNDIGSITADNTLGQDLFNYTRKAYLTTIELKRFDWSPARVLNLAPKGQKISAGTASIVEILPSPDFVNQLLTQIDKCHAMSVDILAEDHYQGLNTLDNSIDKELYGKWWQQYYHLLWEINIAEQQVESLKMDANTMFDKANTYLANNNSPEKMRYLNAFQSSCATYTDRLEQITMYLEQAREAGWKVRCYILSSATSN